jgi:hypothetical protein
MVDGRLRVLVSDLEGLTAQPVPGPDRHEMLVHWSASGEWLYGRVQREKRWELWRRRPDGADAELVSERGCTVLGELPGGDLICARDGDGALWRLPAGGGRAVKVVPAERAGSWAGVAVTGTGLWFLRHGEDGSCLGFFDWATGREDSLAAAPPESGMLSVTATGDRLLFDCTTRFEVDLVLASAAR